jgi:hypothetical protein
MTTEVAQPGDVEAYESGESTPLNQSISWRMLMFFVIGDVLGPASRLFGEVGGDPRADWSPSTAAAGAAPMSTRRSASLLH